MKYDIIKYINARQVVKRNQSEHKAQEKPKHTRSRYLKMCMRLYVHVYVCMCIRMNLQIKH